MRAHIGVDARSGLVHTVPTIPANEADVEVVDELLHGREVVVHPGAKPVTPEQMELSRVRAENAWLRIGVEMSNPRPRQLPLE